MNLDGDRKESRGVLEEAPLLLSNVSCCSMERVLEARSYTPLRALHLPPLSVTQSMRAIMKYLAQATAAGLTECCPLPLGWSSDCVPHQASKRSQYHKGPETLPLVTHGTLGEKLHGF